MDTPSKRNEAPTDERNDSPEAKATQPVHDQSEDEPRVIADNPPIEEEPTPDEPPTPSYTFDLQAALAARSPSPDIEEEEDLYGDDSKSAQSHASKDSSKPRPKSASPERIIESMAPRNPRPADPIWRSAIRNSRRRSTGSGMREFIFVKTADPAKFLEHVDECRACPGREDKHSSIDHGPPDYNRPLTEAIEALRGPDYYLLKDRAKSAPPLQSTPFSTPLTFTSYRGVQYPVADRPSVPEAIPEDQEDLGLGEVSDDLRLERESKRPNYQEERRNDFRQAAYVSRQAMQRRNQANSMGSERPMLPPGIPVTNAEAVKYMRKLQISKPDQFTPFREARIPELRELGVSAPAYNGRVRAREDENVRKADFPAPETAPRQSFLSKYISRLQIFSREKIEDKGRWLCSACTVDLDTLNPREEDRANVERMHQRLGMWPPFKRMQGVNMAMRKCARCQNHEFCALFAMLEEE